MSVSKPGLSLFYAMLTVSQLFIYPIKSLAGIALDQATLTDRGFMYDRRWMLVDVSNRFLTQREIPAMALLQPALFPDEIRITHKKSGEQFGFPLNPGTEENCMATIWDDVCEVKLVSKKADEWFSEVLHTPCKLVFMPVESQRSVDTNYATQGELTSLSDGFPLLIIGQSSLDDLNHRMEIPLPINRFRPNIVFTGGSANQEDDMKHFRINGIDFFGVKPCARCPIPTIDQDNATKSNEPLRTLANYRMRNNKVYFGQNVLFDGEGVITIGDEITLVD